MNLSIPFEFNFEKNVLFTTFIFTSYFKFYEGSYENAAGTYLFFENNKNARAAEPFETQPSLKYFDKTRKVLQMERVFVTPKKDNAENSIPQDT